MVGCRSTQPLKAPGTCNDIIRLWDTRGRCCIMNDHTSRRCTVCILFVSLKHYGLAINGVSRSPITWCQNGRIFAKMEALKAPDPLRVEGNIADNWKKWKQKFKLYMTATGIEGKSQKVQSCTLLHVIGDEALEIDNTFEFTQPETEESSRYYWKNSTNILPPTGM